MTWRMFKGYNETHQLINDTGRIVGHVYGSPYDESSGWAAMIDDPQNTRGLGRHISLEHAKKAVETYLASELE